MELTHARDDQLARVFVGEAAERRIFFRQALQTFGHLITIRLRLRLDRHADDRLREGGRLQHHVERLVTQGVAGGDVPETDQRRDVARVHAVHVLPLAALDDHEAADALALAGTGVVDGVALLQLTGIDPEEDQLAREGIGPQLEREGTELRVVVGRDRDALLGLGHVAGGGRNVERGRQVIDHGVDQDLNALLFEGRPAQDGDQLDLAGQAPDGRLQDRRRDGLLFQHQLGDRVVLVGNGIDQLGQRLGRTVLMLGRDVLDLILEAFVGDVAFTPEDRLLVHHVDDSGELVLGSDGQEDGERVGAQLLAHVVQRVVKVGTGTVHLVDERDPGDVVLRRLAPDRFGLGLDAGHSAKHGNGPVEDAHGALDLRGEIHVTRSVDDVDTVGDSFAGLVKSFVLLLGPEAGDGGGRDRNAALLLLLHPVGDRVAIIHVADLVDQSGVEEDTLGRRRLAGVDVRGDPDVAGPFEGILPRRGIQRRIDFGDVTHGSREEGDFRR